MKSSRNPRLESLRNAAKALVKAGYSVIPVCGDSNASQPKKPAIAWRRFQREIMSAAEIDRVFRGGMSALGIVCGGVSRLLVIDFDDSLGYEKFCRRFPQLAATRTVKTRRGFHLYFRTNAKTPSHQFDGGDVKGERAYVVAPPSVAGDFEYRVARDCEPLELGGDRLDQVLTHLQAGRRLGRVERVFGRAGSTVDVAAMYQRLAPELGRNNALYRCASVARDQGMSEADCRDGLVALHVAAPRRDGAIENGADRLMEAERTIASAYARGHGYSVEAAGVPNSLREFLLRETGSTALARLLDILRLAKWEAGKYFSLGDAVRLAGGYGLGRNSVLEALGGRAAICDGQHIVRRRYVEYLDMRGLNSRGRGRPPRILYQMPSMSELMRRLKLRWSPSDAITAADVKSAHSYRLALHREYIRRLQPRASVAQLAARIGVDPRSIRRYNQQLGGSVVEHVGAFQLSREGLRVLPRRRRQHTKNATNGFWLELADGRRFPAWRHLGSSLLKSGVGAVRVCMRAVSQYSLAPVAEKRIVSSMSAAEFVMQRSRRMAESEGWRRSGAVSTAMNVLRALGKRLGGARIPLSFDSVASRIAEDKVAETIRAYLVARDSDGNEIRRPALRGVAYRMLKEFGEGKVYMRLVDAGRDALAAVERLAGDGGDGPGLVQGLAAALE